MIQAIAHPSAQTQNSTSQPERTMRRLPQVLFGFLQTVPSPNRVAEDISLESEVGASEPPGRQYAKVIGLRHSVFSLPAELLLVPDRVADSAVMKAAGFSDPRSQSVGVDVACWSQPCSDVLDEIAWRRVFTWIVGTDTSLTSVSVLDPPIWENDRLVGSYAYDSSGVPGYGVLQVLASEDGCWHICDCWGDATDASRVDSLSGFAPRS